MLTRLRVRNFKTFADVDISLGQNVVLIGPNNSGKTSALQALTLWRTGLTEWLARRSESGSRAKQRVGVTVNRRSLTYIPAAETRSFWHGLRVSLSSRDNGGQANKPILLDVVVEGETAGKKWVCGLEFQHATPETIYCRPLRADNGAERMPVPEEAGKTKIALLPPMSGLAAEEPELQAGRIAVLLGEGQTAQVLRNLCLQVHDESRGDWATIVSDIYQTFGVTLNAPQRDTVRGSIELSYQEHGAKLDLTSAGRGLQQTLLLLAHLRVNKGGALLLDEPDAHLEILRQRQIYTLLTNTARQTGSQIIAASHSEVLLNEAAEKDMVVAFVGKPHRIDDRGSQVLKSLREIGFEQYYQAETRGFVLYLEGSTDLAILQAFARKLEHPVEKLLEAPFVHYVQNQPKLVQNHYYGLREAKPDLRCAAVFDRLASGLPPDFSVPSVVWRRREIENYLCRREVLMRYASGLDTDDLVSRAERGVRAEAMSKALDKVEQAVRVLGRNPWSEDEKVSDEFLPRVFALYFDELGLENRMTKSNFHVLAEFLERDEIDVEVEKCLDLILAQCEAAKNNVIRREIEV